jgi:hypothetical protein
VRERRLLAATASHCRDGQRGFTTRARVDAGTLFAPCRRPRRTLRGSREISLRARGTAEEHAAFEARMLPSAHGRHGLEGWLSRARSPLPVSLASSRRYLTDPRDHSRGRKARPHHVHGLAPTAPLGVKAGCFSMCRIEPIPLTQCCAERDQTCNFGINWSR